MRLEWPADMEPQQFFDQRVRISKGPQSISNHDSNHQADMERREKSFEIDRYRRQRAAEVNMSSINACLQKTKKLQGPR